MKPVNLNSTLQISLSILIATICSRVNPVYCQNSNIIPDDTLGDKNSTVNVRDETSDKIDGGVTEGSNLFHSFQEFNVREGRGVYFSNPDGINNVFSRVTGSNASNILGKLGVDGAANLYLINPNGILFGKNARLDVNGSFFATTADSVLFDSGKEFSATNPDAPPLLTVDIPIGLQFRDNPGKITNQANFEKVETADEITGLKVDPGKTITLIGGNISLEGSGLTAPGGNIELGSVSESGTVTINPDSSLSFPEDMKKGNIDVLDKAGVNVRGNGAGFIRVNARNLTIAGESLVAGGIIDKDMDSRGVVTGDIIINASNIFLNDGTIANQVLKGGLGDAGNINISTDSLKSTANSSDDYDPSFIGTDNKSGREGNSGNIDIRASDTIKLNKTNISSELGDFKGETSTKGIAGNIRITANNSLILENESQLLSKVNRTSEGDSGNITITTDYFSLSGNSNVVSNINGMGNAGNTVLKIGDTLSLDASDIRANVSQGAIGAGGNIKIEAPKIILKNGSRLVSGTDSEGSAGKIELRTNLLLLDNFSLISSNTNENSEGNGGIIDIKANKIEILNESSINAFSNNSDFDGGKINITAKTVELSRGGTIFSGTNGNGHAGDIQLNIGEILLSDGNIFPNKPQEIAEREKDNKSNEENKILDNVAEKTGIFANTIEGSQGNGGDITIGVFENNNNELSLAPNQSTNQIILKNGEIIADSQGKGRGGTIAIYTQDLNLDGGIISVATAFKQPKKSNAGEQELSNIKLFVDNNLTLRNNSRISATAMNNANGGNINIEASVLIAFPSQRMGSDISANAALGSGGNINIISKAIFGLREQANTANNNTNDIDASSEFGSSGQVSIEQPDIDPNSGALELTTNIVDTSQLIIQNVCQQTANSEFVDIGKGGLPENPNEFLTGENIEIGLVAPVKRSEETSLQNRENRERIAAVTAKEGRKPPAQGLVWHEDGSVELVAYDPEQLGEQRDWNAPNSCQ